MSKTIRLDDNTYAKLERLRGKRETFSEATNRLLEIHAIMGSLTDTIEGGISFREGQKDRLEIVKEARLERADLESRRLDK